MKCSQCEKLAIIVVGEGNIPLCVEHYALFSRTLMEQLAANERQMNFLLDHMDEMVGIPSHARFRTPAPIIHKGDTVVNQLNIDGSTIGILNTGTIENLDSTISMIEKAGNAEVAKVIKEFTETVSKNIEITNEAKKEIIEQLSFLATQIRTPQSNRSSSVIKTVFKNIGSVVSISAALVELWGKLEPMIKRFLS